MERIMIPLAAVLLLLGLPAWAEIRELENTPDLLRAEITTHYIMGDLDTREDARRLALESAKQKAAEWAGAFVQSEHILQDGKPSSQTVVTYAASFMSTKVLEERLAVINGRAELELQILVEVDKKTLRKDFANLNLDRTNRLKGLEQENAELRRQLLELTGSHPADIDFKRKSLLERLDQNRVLVRQVFTKGTLYEMAKKSIASKDAIIEDLQHNVLEVLQRETRIKVHEPQFSADPDGTVDITIPISYETPIKIKNVLSKYFNINPLHYHRPIDNKKGTPFHLLRPIGSVEVFAMEVLQLHKAIIIISFGRLKSEFPILTLTEYGPTVSFAGYRNFKFYSVNTEELKNLESIDVEVVLNR